MASKNKPTRTALRRKALMIASVLLIVSATMLCVACSVSVKFNGASIDYSKTKSIQIGDFPIRSTYVWSPMQSIFQNQLTDIYARQTRLQQVKRNADLVLEGEIVGFDQFNKGVSNSGYSNQVQLKMTVNVRYTNNNNHDEDFEQKFTATSTYDATQQLVNVQEELVTQMCKDITEQIFNTTVANW